jgi:hypothetical protein
MVQNQLHNKDVHFQVSTLNLWFSYFKEKNRLICNLCIRHSTKEVINKARLWVLYKCSKSDPPQIEVGVLILRTIYQ